MQIQITPSMQFSRTEPYGHGMQACTRAAVEADVSFLTSLRQVSEGQELPMTSVILAEHDQSHSSVE